MPWFMGSKGTTLWRKLPRLGLLLGVCCSCWLQVFAQTPTGLPFITNYTPREYRAETQTWAGAQDSRGILYVGNSDGVLEFDGTNWRLIQTTTKTIARALATDSTGRIFVGAKEELGYLAPDAKGAIEFVSLKHLLPDSIKAIGRISRVLPTPVGVWFVSETHLMCYRAGKFSVWGSPTKWEWVHWQDGALWAFDLDTGIYQMGAQGPKLRTAYKGTIFNDIRPVGVYQAGSAGWHIYTRSHGVLVYDGKKLKKLQGPSQQLLEKLRPYVTIALSGNRVAIGTLEDGVYVADSNCCVQQFYNTSYGLIDPIVLGLFEDRDRSLWIFTNNGISHTFPNDPLGVFDARIGLKHGANGITRHKNNYYIVTSQGLYTLQEAAANGRSLPEPKLTALKTPATDFWSICNARDQLLVGSSKGVYNYSPQGYKLLNRNTSFVIHQSLKHPDWSFIGTDKGLELLHWEGGAWRYHSLMKVIPEEIRTLYESPDGTIWLGTLFQGVLSFQFDPSSPAAPINLRRYGNAEGLPGMNQNNVFGVGGKAVIGTQQGAYCLDSKTGRLVPDARFQYLLGERRAWVYRVAEMPNGRVLLYTYPDRHIYVGDWNEKSQAYLPMSLKLMRLQDFDLYSMAMEGDSLLWMAGADGLMRYDMREKALPHQSFATLIRSVRADSLLFAGTFLSPEGVQLPTQAGAEVRELPYSQNTLRFDCGATTFDVPRATHYRYKLQGFDKGWSDWTPEANKVYTNLPHGTHTLHVQARNIYGQIGSEAAYIFRILRPWYLSLWAYLGYFLLFGGVVYGAIRLNGYRLEREKDQLEALVMERTRELAEGKSQLEFANKEIADQNEQLGQTLEELRATQSQLILSEKMAALGHLVDGVAHEMNTPMGVIKASVSNLQTLYPDLLESFPTWLASMPEPERKEMIDLVHYVVVHRKELSTKDERAYRRMLIEQLEWEKIPDAEDTARRLVELGMVNELPRFLPLLKRPSGARLLDYVHSLGRMRVAMDNIEVATGKTQKIVFTLRTYGKMQKDRYTVAFQVAPTVEEVLTIHANHFRTGIQLVRDFGTVPPVQANPVELAQVWNNLVVNALHAMQGQGTLTIRIFEEHSRVCISVQDTGPGIPADIQGKILEPFFTTKPAGEGTGLGLDICQKILDKIAGVLTFESQPGNTVFTVRLPAYREEL